MRNGRSDGEERLCTRKQEISSKWRERATPRSSPSSAWTILDLSSSISSFNISSIYSAIAGDDVKPGDSIPAALMNPLMGEFIIKSPVLPTERKPQKEVIVLLTGADFNVSAVLLMIAKT